MIADQYPKFDLKKKIVASLSVFTIVISTLLYFIVIPTIKDIKTMGRGIEEQRIDLERKYIKGQSLKKLSENLLKIEPKLKLLDQIFINKNRELEFITTLENEANKSQIGQKINLNSPETTENNEFKKNKLQLFTNGEFTKQLRYLMNLESLSYYINIKILELTPSSGGEIIETAKAESSADQNQTNRINIFIDANTYWK